MTNKKQEKLQETIVNVTAQIVHEKHLYHIGVRKSKPSYNQLYKICAEYIALGLQNIKKQHNLEIVPIKDKTAIVIDERFPNMMKPSIMEYAVYEYSFYIVRGTKKKYTITASGVVKEGLADKVTQEFINQYVALVQVVNELLEYGCMVALYKLNNEGTLYLDEDLIELLKLAAQEQVKNDFEDTNEREQVDQLFAKIDTIISIFIQPGIALFYNLDSEAKQRPLLGFDYIDSDDGANVTEVLYVKGKYEIVRTTGEPLDTDIVNTLGNFIIACDFIFSAYVKQYREETLENV